MKLLTYDTKFENPEYLCIEGNHTLRAIHKFLKDERLTEEQRNLFNSQMQIKIYELPTEWNNDTILYFAHKQNDR